MIPTITDPSVLTEACRPHDKPRWQIRTVIVKGSVTSASHRAQVWGWPGLQTPRIHSNADCPWGAVPRVIANRRYQHLPLPFCPFLKGSPTIPSHPHKE